ncbi:hypothetical protein KBP30_01195 [Streptomyces sp. Go40/10]|uniref:hypothetical protein n=1 Tax=Streptomyces sp. Go40/10 TaxID=2825844 RepID=UPI001E48D9D9|nr:hypothetical protein [Streptomyces sp. Go40/10]UFQ99918.1 hypothetical protein KBP30_01195 [Streptomyces sp. Go40/10]
MRPSPTKARTPRRLSVATVLAAALCAGATLLAPASFAQQAAPSEPVVCESTAQDTLKLPDIGAPGGTTYEGTGTVTCKDDQGKIYLEGTSTFSGTIPVPNAADGITPVYRARVDWNDGTVTTGTFTDFREKTGSDGITQVTINGVNDASSTRFASWSTSIAAQSLRASVDPNGEIHNKLTGTVTYRP